MDPLCGRAGSTGDASMGNRNVGHGSADTASCPQCEVDCELSEARRSERFSDRSAVLTISSIEFSNSVVAEPEP